MKPRPVINPSGLSELYFTNNPNFTYLPEYLEKIEPTLNENSLLFLFEYGFEKPKIIENIKNIHNNLFKYNFAKDIIKEQLLDENWKLKNNNKSLEEQIINILDIEKDVLKNRKEDNITEILLNEKSLDRYITILTSSPKGYQNLDFIEYIQENILFLDKKIENIKIISHGKPVEGLESAYYFKGCFIGYKFYL